MHPGGKAWHMSNNKYISNLIFAHMLHTYRQNFKISKFMWRPQLATRKACFYLEQWIGWNETELCRSIVASPRCQGPDSAFDSSAIAFGHIKRSSMVPVGGWIYINIYNGMLWMFYFYLSLAILIFLSHSFPSLSIPHSYHHTWRYKILKHMSKSRRGNVMHLKMDQRALKLEISALVWEKIFVDSFDWLCVCCWVSSM